MLSKITQPQKDNYHVFLSKCNGYLVIYLSFFCHLLIYLSYLLCIYVLINYLTYIPHIYHLSITYWPIYLYHLSRCITYVIKVEGGQFGGRKGVQKDEGQEGN